MEKPNRIWLWAAGLALTAIASAAAYAAGSPREPLIVTYQSTEQPVSAVTEAAETTARRQKKSVKTDTTTTQTEITAPPQTDAAAADRNITDEIPERDLNAAGVEDLKRVTGVGDVLAEAIVAYRDAHGGFRRRAELLEIDGIGTVLQERILAEFYIPDELPPEEPQQEEIADPEQPAQATEPVPAETDAPAETEPPVHYYNINTVTKEELMRIPDMTEVLADSILDLRERLGGYHNVYELGLIDGLNGRYFEDVLKQYLYIEE